MLTEKNKALHANSAVDLHTACRVGDLNSIKLAYQSFPTKINEKDSGVIFI